MLDENYQSHLMTERDAGVKKHDEKITACGDDLAALRKLAHNFAEDYESACARERLQRHNEAEKRAEEQAAFITGMLNDSRFDRTLFFKAMDNEHRTLQSYFGELCLKWFEHCISDDYRTDGRNEWMKTKGQLLHGDGHI